MKVFVDLGAYNGDTIELAMERFPDCDKYIGFEPYEANFKVLEQRFGNHPKVEIYKEAVGIHNGFQNLYMYRDVNPLKDNLSVGNSLFPDKTNVTDKFDVVKVRDICSIMRLYENDEVILKIDVEGAEYDILEYLLREGLMKDNIKKLYVEWHNHKMTSVGLDRHNILVNTLNEKGFRLTGVSKSDEFYRE